MVRRIQPAIAARQRGRDSETQPSLEQWLDGLLGASENANNEPPLHIAVVDLSLVPPDVTHLIISVIARIVFEAMQRFRKLGGSEVPTVLALEEAHTFISRGTVQTEETVTASDMCRQTFERIAREGRKFGLGLVVSSQRPSELSPTVLAQCNTFLLHRLVNDRDQDLVKRLVPDNVGGLLAELPSLPTRKAVFLGWATEIPMLTEIREVNLEHQPSSADPKFWEVWTGEERLPVQWAKVVRDWTN